MNSIFFKFKTIVLGLLLAFFLGEIVNRVAYRSLLTSDNFILRDFSLEREQHYQSDPVLSWSHKANTKNTAPTLKRPQLKPWQFTIRTFDENSFRNHPQVNVDRLRLKSKPIITLGDSFTFGGDVNDEESWPFHLEQLSGYPILNAGVNRYGLDQSFLQLNRIIKSGLRPKAVILSITPLNVSRTTLTHLIATTSLKPRAKPYFLPLEDSNLELHLSSPETFKPNYKLGPARNILGKSALVHSILSLISFKYWYGIPAPELGVSPYRTNVSSIKLSCSILKKIKQLSDQYRFIFVALIQDYHQTGDQVYRSSELTQGIIPCLSNENVHTIESSNYLKPLFESSPSEYHTLFFPGSHMTNRGNLMMAKLVYEDLKTLLRRKHSP